MVDTPVPNWTPLALAVAFASLVITIGDHVLVLFWPRWIASGVSFFLGWAPAWYFLMRHQRGVRSALSRSLIGAALGGGLVSMVWYVVP